MNLVFLRNVYTLCEALPGDLGNRGTRAFILGEQGHKGIKMRGTGNKFNFVDLGSKSKFLY